MTINHSTSYALFGISRRYQIFYPSNILKNVASLLRINFILIKTIILLSRRFGIQRPYIKEIPFDKTEFKWYLNIVRQDKT